MSDPKYKQVPDGTKAFRVMLRDLPKLRRAGIDFTIGEERMIPADSIDAEQAFWLFNEPAMRVEALSEMPSGTPSARAPIAPPASAPSDEGKGHGHKGGK